MSSETPFNPNAPVINVLFDNTYGQLWYVHTDGNAYRHRQVFPEQVATSESVVPVEASPVVENPASVVENGSGHVKTRRIIKMLENVRRVAASLLFDF